MSLCPTDEPDLGVGITEPGCRAFGLVRNFADGRCVSELTFAQGRPHVAHTAAAEWACQLQVVPVEVGKGCFDVMARFTIRKGHAATAGVAVVFEFENWSTDNYVLFPSAAYNGNRFEVRHQAYPPLWRDACEFRHDMPTTISNLPRLATGPGVSKIELTSGDMATPAMGFQSPSTQRGFWALTSQASRFGNLGMTLEESDDRRTARLMITAPCIRESQYRFASGGMVAGTERGVAWNAGDSIELHIRAWFFEAPAIQDLFDQFEHVRKNFSRQAMPDQQVPFSAALQIEEEKYNRDNWDEEHGYYRIAVNADTTWSACENPLCFLWQAGWVGGGIVTLPLLYSDSELTRQRALRNLAMLFERAQSPSGFVYGTGDGQRFYSDGFDTPHPHNLHLIRKSADVLFWAIKQFDLLRRQNREIPETWQYSVRKIADAFSQLWERFAQFGQFVDIETGDLLIGSSTAGAAAPGGLALASKWFADDGYLGIARAAAQDYYDRDVRRGVITGGPGEILSAPDSESTYALFESFVILYEVTLEPKWLDMARDTLRQLATWVVSYDHVFPEGSSLQKAGVRSTGAVWANVQNKHAAPGFCTASGDALLKYWRATGDALALDLLRDVAHALPQFMSRVDRPLSERMRPGWICERVNMSDWEGPEAVGGNVFFSAWPEVSLMATAVEVPGLYVQPDTGFYCVFDHIEVEHLGQENGKLKLRLNNPTQFPARVRVLCEHSTATRQPLGLNALHNGHTVDIAPGQTRIESFSSDPAR